MLLGVSSLQVWTHHPMAEKLMSTILPLRRTTLWCNSLSQRSTRHRQLVIPLSGTFRCPRFVMLLWLAGIAAYFAYVLKSHFAYGLQLPSDGNWSNTRCNKNGSGCSIANEGLLAGLHSLPTRAPRRALYLRGQSRECALICQRQSSLWLPVCALE